MDIVKNLGWARQRCSRYVHFNIDEPDEAFSGPASDPYQQIDDALNEGLTQILNKVVNSTDPDYFKISIPMTWLANVIQLALPVGVDRVSILELRDVTMGYPGVQIRPTFGYNSTSEIYWSGINLITWGVQGPPSDKTLLINYVAGPKILKDPNEEPDLLPYRFRDLWPLAAAIILRQDVDEDNIPQAWLDRFKQLEWDFHDAINQRSEAGSYNSPTKSAILP
jgi:hypothetical protein